MLRRTMVEDSLQDPPPTLSPRENFMIASTSFSLAQDIQWSRSGEPTFLQLCQARSHRDWFLAQAFWKLAFHFWQVALSWNVWDVSLTCTPRLWRSPIWVCPCLWPTDMGILQSALCHLWMAFHHADVGNSCQSPEFGKILILNWFCAPGATNKGSISWPATTGLHDVFGRCFHLPDPRLRSGDRGAAPDVAAAQSHQGDIEAGEVWFGAAQLADGMGASDGTPTSTARNGTSTSTQGRPGHMPASNLHQVREQQRFIQQVPSMRPVVQMGPKSRRMGSSWRASVATFFAFATSLIFQHPADHGRSYERQGQDLIEGHFTTSKAKARPPTPDGLHARERSRIRDRSIGVSTGLRQQGGRLHGMGCADGSEGFGIADKWQVDGHHVTRVHHVPRKVLFCLDELYNVPDPCPVHVHRLCSECTVEMSYKDGRNQTNVGCWLVNPPPPPPLKQLGRMK